MRNDSLVYNTVCEAKKLGKSMIAVIDSIRDRLGYETPTPIYNAIRREESRLNIDRNEELAVKGRMKFVGGKTVVQINMGGYMIVIEDLSAHKAIVVKDGEVLETSEYKAGATVESVIREIRKRMEE